MLVVHVHHVYKCQREGFELPFFYCAVVTCKNGGVSDAEYDCGLENNNIDGFDSQICVDGRCDKTTCCVRTFASVGMMSVRGQ